MARAPWPAATRPNPATTERACSCTRAVSMCARAACAACCRPTAGAAACSLAPNRSAKTPVGTRCRATRSCSSARTARSKCGRCRRCHSTRMPTRTLQLPIPRPFELRLCLFGHGWVALAPHRFDEASQVFSTVLLVDGQAVDATLRHEKKDALTLRLESARPLRGPAATAAGRQIAHMLRLRDDLGAFHAMCRKEPSLQWAARRGAGRMLRSATVFEDLMKLLFTTNTTWAGTEAMTKNLVEAAGSAAPSGARAFPSPWKCHGSASL